MEDFAPLLRAQLDGGVSREEALAHLKLAGASPVETIKAVREVLGVTLAEAKKIFEASPAWQREVRSARELHEEFFRILDEDGA